MRNLLGKMHNFHGIFYALISGRSPAKELRVERAQLLEVLRPRKESPGGLSLSRLLPTSISDTDKESM